jgi:cytochrome d ubiquinol oxidase subunit II
MTTTSCRLRRRIGKQRGISVLTFWVSILALSILLYGLLCQFDLGIGILLRFAREEGRRQAPPSPIAPIRNGHGMWLIVAGFVLCVAFPVVCATLLSAFYVPFLLMLAGLILRRVAAERREQSPQQLPRLWCAIFSGGSLVAAFTQGLMLGALVEGLIISRGEYSGDDFAWWSLLAVLCGGGGLCIGYALLGAFWLVRKFESFESDVGHEGDVGTAAYRLIPALSLVSLLALIFVFVFSLAANIRIMSRWPAVRAAYPHVVLDRSPAVGDQPRPDGP